ncbi:MAG: hypothetical protein KC416_13535 [Myxococcales bacterium]|nr:hypothetical protein [Myxococcales bacterium]
MVLADSTIVEVGAVAPLKWVAPALAGNSLGELWAYQSASGEFEVVDKETGTILRTIDGEGKLPVGNGAKFAKALAQWGGHWYAFTAEKTSGTASATSVHRYNPEDGSFMKVASIDGHVRGASASTCAPPRVL